MDGMLTSFGGLDPVHVVGILAIAILLKTPITNLLHKYQGKLQTTRPPTTDWEKRFDMLYAEVVKLRPLEGKIDSLTNIVKNLGEEHREVAEKLTNHEISCAASNAEVKTTLSNIKEQINRLFDQFTKIFEKK